MMGIISLNVDNALSAGNPLDTFQKNLPAEILGWEAKTKDLVFNSDTIFDYINGAGEVYLSYEMRRCLSRRFIRPNHPDIILDIFDMGTSENAFGVFTHDREGEETNIGQEALYSNGWLRFWKDRYYVSIYPEAETKTAKEAVIALGHTVASVIKHEGPKPRILLRLPPAGLRSKSVRFLHDPVILNYHYYLSDENILLLGDETDVVLAEYHRGKNRAHLLLASYSGRAKAVKAHSNLLRSYMTDSGLEGIIRLENGRWAASQIKNRVLVFVLEANSRSFAEGLMREVMELITE